MSRWNVYAKKADFKEIGQRFGVDQVIARIIRNRDIITDEEYALYLNGSMSDLHNPNYMKDLNKCVDILKDKIRNKTHIRIIGDYDIDGICSTTILYKGIKEVGGNVDYRIPHRVTDGYGINMRLIDEAIEDGVDTIITCDNGISAIEQVQYAKENGITVIITDHHEVHFEEIDGERVFNVPQADAVVDPKQEDCTYPYDKICGAMVAYKVIQALFHEYEISITDNVDYEVLAAIATVGDVVELLDENRVIVKCGLKDIPQCSMIGLKKLIELSELDEERITTYHVGFVIGPCLNASGRLDTAMLAVELMLTNNIERANEIASQLKFLNDERKELTERAVEEAIQVVENTEIGNDNVLVIYIPNCNESVAGIVAGRIKERYYKPTFVITDGEEGAKGSGRSIEAYNMYEEMVACEEWLSKYGGHPMAAGLSLPVENIEGFRKALNDHQTLTEEDLIQTIMIDVPMPVDYVTFNLIQQLDAIAPFGTGNPKPIFAEKGLIVRTSSIIGKNRNVLKLTLQNKNGKLVEAIQFKVDEDTIPNVGEIIDIVYYPTINEFRGQRNIQFTVEEWLPSIG